MCKVSHRPRFENILCDILLFFVAPAFHVTSSSDRFNFAIITFHIRYAVQGTQNVHLDVTQSTTIEYCFHLFSVSSVISPANCKNNTPFDAWQKSPIHQWNIWNHRQPTSEDWMRKYFKAVEFANILFEFEFEFSTWWSHHQRYSILRAKSACKLSFWCDKKR